MANEKEMGMPREMGMSREMSSSNGGGGHLYMQTNEVKNASSTTIGLRTGRLQRWNV